MMEGQSLSLVKERKLVKQVLYQTKRTKPSAYGPSQKASKEKEEPQHAKRDLDILLVQERLQGAQRAGCNSSGAGITIQPRYTGIFKISPIDSAG